jgi:hypothetical protein
VLQGATFQDALHLIDFTQDLPLMHQEGRGHAGAAHWGGYALVSPHVLSVTQQVCAGVLSRETAARYAQQK